MTFSYSLATSTGKIRLNIGDTVEQSNESLTDEEIAIALTETTDVLVASIRCMEWRIARLSNFISNSAAGQNVQTNQRFEQAQDLYNRLKARCTKGGSYVYAGGISQDRLDSAKTDTDFPQPAFEVGMDDHDSDDDGDDD